MSEPHSGPIDPINIHAFFGGAGAFAAFWVPGLPELSPGTGIGIAGLGGLCFAIAVSFVTFNLHAKRHPDDASKIDLSRFPYYILSTLICAALMIPFIVIVAWAEPLVTSWLSPDPAAN